MLAKKKACYYMYFTFNHTPPQNVLISIKKHLWTSHYINKIYTKKINILVLVADADAVVGKTPIWILFLLLLMKLLLILYLLLLVKLITEAGSVSSFVIVFKFIVFKFCFKIKL